MDKGWKALNRAIAKIKAIESRPPRKPKVVRRGPLVTLRYDPAFPYRNPPYIRDAGNPYFGWCKTCNECGFSWSPQLNEHHKEDCSHFSEDKNAFTSHNR